MVCKNRGIYGFLGPSWVLITMVPHTTVKTTTLQFMGVHSNQDLIWCVKIGAYMGFWVHRGS